MLKKNLYKTIFDSKDNTLTMPPGIRDFVYDTWEKVDVSKNFFNDSLYRKSVIKGGFIKDSTIDFPIYNINSNGFRSDEFNTSDNGIVCLGCSDSFGHWQYEYKVWPYLLGKYFNQKVWNLSIPGADIGLNYINFRTHSHRINFDKVFILIPSPVRRLTLVKKNNGEEKFKVLKPFDKSKLHKYFSNYNLDDESVELLFKYYVESSNVVEQDFYVNSYLDSIANIARKNNAKLYWIPNITYFSREFSKAYYSKIFDPSAFTDKALDGIHLGSSFQKAVFNVFTRLVKKKYKI